MNTNNTPSPAAIRAALACVPSFQTAYDAGHFNAVKFIHERAAKIDAEFKPLVEFAQFVAGGYAGNIEEMATAALPDYTPPATAGESEKAA